MTKNKMGNSNCFFLNWALRLQNKSEKNHRYKQAKYLRVPRETELLSFMLCLTLTINHLFVAG